MQQKRFIGWLSLLLVARPLLGTAVEGKGSSEVQKTISNQKISDIGKAPAKEGAKCIEVAPTQSRAAARKKKSKAHFAGIKRPVQNAPGYQPSERPDKKPRKIKNKWVRSKTQPKSRSSKGKRTS